MRTRQLFIAIAALFVAGLLIGPAQALGQPSAPQPDAPTAAELLARRDALDESQQAARTLYDEAIGHLDRASASRQSAASFRAEADGAPAKLASIREELLRPISEPAPVVPEGATLAQLEQGEADAIAALAAAREFESQLQAETTKRQDRRIQIQDALPQRRQDLLRVDEALNAPASPGDSPELTDARRASLLAERQAITSRIEELEAERASYDARRDLLPARRDRASRRVVEAESLVKSWRQLVSARRQQEAARSAQEAERLRRQTARQHPVLQSYAAETQRLAEQRTQPNAIPQRINRASQQVSEANSAFSDLRQRYIAVKQRIDASGLDRATGLMLRREFESLPNLSVLERRAAAVSRELEDIEYLLFERRDDRRGSDDINTVREQLLAEIGEAGNREDLEAAATELAIARRDVLAELENDADRYQDVLVDLDRESQQLFEATSDYESFIRERILWVRSIPADQVDVIADLGATWGWLLSTDDWKASWENARSDTVKRFPSVLFSAAVIVLLFAGAQVSVRRIGDAAEQVKRYRTDRFSHTLRVVLFTAIAASPVAVLLWWVGWVFARPISQEPVAVAVGTGLQDASYLLFALSLVRQAVRPRGLLDAHFRWSATVTSTVRGHLRWFIPVVIPAVGLIATVSVFGDERSAASLGRIGFTVIMLAGVVLLHMLLRPKGPIAREWLEDHEGGWLDRLKYILYVLILLVPIDLVVLSWMGFYYTAIQLEQRLQATVLLAFALVLANGLLLRWLFLARRKVTVEDAKRRREQAIAQAKSGHAATEEGPTESSVPAIDEDKLDLPNISSQTRQLFRTAVWITAAIGVFTIWADVLPALRMLDSIEIYPTPRVVESDEDAGVEIFETGITARAAATQTGSDGASAANGSNAGSNGASGSGSSLSLPGLPSTGSADATASAESDEGLTITVADIGVALIVLLATYVAFRNLPGLTEIVVLQRLPLDAGSRYALSTVLKYTITIIGLAAAFGALNISWSNVQWLAAALTFGLAFGLQEIFANFISGLIILAERPIRIGDTVTVGSVSGTVTRIRMRATLITDWDRKELVVPNKNFITGEVINWSLSDPTLRLIIQVGVGYGEDVRKAEKILLEIAKKAANVLKDPKPYVVFGGLGESTLDFELRVFIPHVDHILTVKTELHMRIIERFREEDIEIAFPQRDLHVRSVGELRELIVGPGKAGGKDA